MPTMSDTFWHMGLLANNDHQAWADYTWYYATWWKSGASPTIATDRVYMWARPHPKNAAVCSNDGVGSVLNANWADDLLYISCECPRLVLHIKRILMQILYSVPQVSRSSILLLWWKQLWHQEPEHGRKWVHCSALRWRCWMHSMFLDLCSSGWFSQTNKVTRNGVTIINYRPTDFTYSTSPSVCNVSGYYDFMRARLWYINRWMPGLDFSAGNHEVLCGYEES
jgi:hypothetical protein